MSKKVFIIDTNVILSDANSIFKFDEHEVIIPQPVLVELDSKKMEQTEIGKNSRQFSRNLDVLRTKGNILQGVKVNDKGGILRVITYNLGFERYLPYQDMSIKDNMILACALSIPQTSETDVILVTNDTNMRINADIFGLKAESYKNDKVSENESYTGFRTIEVAPHELDEMYDSKKFQNNIIDNPLPNECFIFKSGKQSALVRYMPDGYMRLLPQDMKTFDIFPKNVEQCFCLDILKDNNINLVSMVGKAGSGKTLISLAAGLDAVLNKQLYKKIMLFKPIISADNTNELGFLPGNLIEKLSPWMASYVDNISHLMSNYLKDEDNPRRKKTSTKKEANVYQEKQPAKTNPLMELMELDLLEMGSLEHLRGRSIKDCYIIIDECQNVSRNLIKTIISRAGDGTKIIMLGDIHQIDSPYLDSTSNGLSYVVEKSKYFNLAGHITLQKSERSELAEWASNNL